MKFYSESCNNHEFFCHIGNRKDCNRQLRVVDEDKRDFEESYMRKLKELGEERLYSNSQQRIIIYR